MAKGIFIVGSGHCGTSILIRMLGAHPQIYAIPGESQLFRRKGKKVTAQLARFDAAAAGYTYWVEKTPQHVLNIKDIITARPEAKIVGIFRDPRDVACSFIAGQRAKITSVLPIWAKACSCLLAHLNKPYLFTLTLEELVKSPAVTCNRLLDFLSLPKHDLTKYHETGSVDWYTGRTVHAKDSLTMAHVRRRDAQVNQPLMKSTERWVKEMTPALRAEFIRCRPHLITRLESVEKYFGHSWPGLLTWLKELK